MTVPRWMNNNLFRSLTLWLKKIKPNQFNGWVLCCLPWCFGFCWLMGRSNCLAIWPSRRATEKWPIKSMPVWVMALWKPVWEFKGCIKVGYVNAQQKNPLLGLEGDWNCQVDILVCSPKGVKVGLWNKWIWGYWSNAEIGWKSRHVLLERFEA